MKRWHERVADEEAMQALGARLAALCPWHTLIFLQGDLGAGKSTLARGFISARGYDGRIKSPTYTLVEPYPVDDHTLYHLDLYRLNDAEELEFIGIREFFDGQAICLVEWPEKGQGCLPQPDLTLRIEHLPRGREVEIIAHSPRGEEIISELQVIDNNLE